MTATPKTFTVAVVANRAPVISGTPSTTATIGQAYSFTPTASDPDGNPLTFSVQNLPTWATFSTTTGTLSGTPATAATHSNIIISVSDGALSASLAAFTITVQGIGQVTGLTVTGTTSSSVSLSWTAVAGA